MFTKNYYIYDSSLRFLNVGDLSYTDINGVARSYFKTSNIDYLRNALITPTNYLIIGSGTTPSSINDYNLESKISSSNYSLSVGTTKTIEDGKVIFKHIITITNITSDVLSISEIGVSAQIHVASSSLGNVLIERSTFDPITLESNEVAQITYEIVYSYPTA